MASLFSVHHLVKLLLSLFFFLVVLPFVVNKDEYIQATYTALVLVLHLFPYASTPPPHLSSLFSLFHLPSQHWRQRVNDIGQHSP